jgi:glycogen phosphorylase
MQVNPALPKALEPLRALSSNMRWTWDSDTAALFERLDPVLWQQTGHNPVQMIRQLEAAEAQALAADPGLVDHVERAAANLDAYLARAPQISIEHTSDADVVAYFSFEFAITESFATYSGGLGVLAGDHLKSASDLGLPLVGMSLFYREGYFQQVLGPDGWQSEDYHAVDPADHPLHRVLDESGAHLTVRVPFPGREVAAAIWRLDVGQTPLYLLDTDTPENTPEDRRIAARLYGGDGETRIQQEMVLGIGGVRALRALGLRPAVCHMNEGHSSLLAVERIRMLMEEEGVSFSEARVPVTAATAFTTHTAVAAGIDLFPPELVRTYLGGYYASFGLDDRTFLGLGRPHPGDEHEPFSMALLGLRLSGFKNGVSKLHRAVSQKLWEAAWPGVPAEQAPIAAVTNGVHLPSWVSHEMGGLFDRFAGREWRDDPLGHARWQAIHDIPDDELWTTHERQRGRLIARARHQARTSRLERGATPATPPLNPEALTIGFARRFAAYKRATLLFRDPDRLAAIVNNAERPVQFLFAGKAHPRDEPAKQLIREVFEQCQRPEFRDRLLVLEKYDVELARSLVGGCDVWLNTPLRPLEASGTSGMKAVANGALHLSVLDGWWAEAYEPALGWAIGGERPHSNPEAQDAFDADALYDLLERDVVPLFYNRDADNLPRGWIQRMKGSIATFSPQFSTHRMVTEYAQRAYVPAARAWAELTADGLRHTREAAAWDERVRAAWQGVKICDVNDSGEDSLDSGTPVTVEVQVHFGALSPEDCRVEVVHGPAAADGAVRADTTVTLALSGRQDDGICQYRGTFVPETGGRHGYAVRVVPGHPRLIAEESGLVVWA